MPPERWAHGPFVAIQPGGDGQIIDAIGAGWMVGFKRTDDPEDMSSWNIGLGIIVDPFVKILDDGVRAGEPLLAGETKVRLKETSQSALMVLASFRF